MSECSEVLDVQLWSVHQVGVDLKAGRPKSGWWRPECGTGRQPGKVDGGCVGNTVKLWRCRGEAVLLQPLHGGKP